MVIWLDLISVDRGCNAGDMAPKQRLLWLDFISVDRECNAGDMAPKQWFFGWVSYPLTESAMLASRGTKSFLESGCDVASFCYSWLKVSLMEPLPSV